MKPTLILHPIHNSSADILKTFALGQPLSPEQLNFLAWHQDALSNGFYDPILNYYLKSYRQKRQKIATSFLLPHEEMNREAIELLKKRIQMLLKDKNVHPVISLTQKQYLQFREYAIKDLIFWHGNQFLTGAPFYPSAIPPVVYFQWGNFFGIVKFVVIEGEKTLKQNLLVYFEDMQERNLDQCVEEYQHHLQEEMKLQHEVVLQYNQEDPEKTEKNSPQLTPSHFFMIDNH